MAVRRNEIEKRKINRRLERIAGQVRAAERMIDEGAECMEILRLLNSISGALKGVWIHILGDHLKGCISNALTRRDTKLADELVEYLRKVR